MTIEWSEESQLKSDFEAFVNEPIDPLFENIEYREDEVVIDVFYFTPNDPNQKLLVFDLQNGGATSANSLKKTIFAVAKVVGKGPKVAYELGDLVRLRDIDVATVRNPKADGWDNNPYNKSNVKPIGTKPQAYLSNLDNTYGNYYFKSNPFSDGGDKLVFKVHQAKLEGKVKDYTKYFI